MCSGSTSNGAGDGGGDKELIGAGDRSRWCTSNGAGEVAIRDRIDMLADKSRWC